MPPWALAPGAVCEAAPCVEPPAPEFLPAFRRFAELAAIRYPEAVGFEAWNEPNLPVFWPAPDPARYADLLAAIYAGVKDGAPETPVLGGAVANTIADDPASGVLSLSSFLDGIFAAGAAEHMDGLSIHAYPVGVVGGPDDDFTPQVLEAQRIAAGASPGSRLGLWVTETGITTQPGAFAPAMTEAEQASQLMQIYQSLSASELSQMVAFHTLLDPTPEVPGGPGFGWFSLAGEASAIPKAVVCAFRRLSEAEGCPASVLLE